MVDAAAWAEKSKLTQSLGPEDGLFTVRDFKNAARDPLDVFI